VVMADTEVVIECGDALGIADVGDLYAKLLTEVAEGNTVRFDVSQLERIDGAALQMMYAYTKEAASQGNTLKWEEPSDAFLRSARLLGLLSVMNIEDNTVENIQ